MDISIILSDTIDHLKFSIRELDNMVFYKKELLKKVILYQQSKCNHNWNIDYIDQLDGYKESVTIKYCDICEYTNTNN